MTVLSKEQGEVVSRIRDLEAALNANVLERQTESRTAVVAVLSRKHHCQIGPPGIAKSYLVRTLFGHIEGLNDEDLYQLLLTNFTAPEELCGIPSFEGIQKDEYRRNTAWKLPRARIAFLDEIFNGSTSILNILLTMLNERLFYNGAAPETIPLETVFGASNTTPKGGNELDALWDRLHFRHEVKALQNKANFVKMLKMPKMTPVPCITWDEITLAQQWVREVEIPNDIYDTLTKLREKLLKEHNIEVTDRRFKESLPIIQATSILNGRMVAEIDDMRLLQHVLWTQTEHAKLVGTEVIHLANPIDQKADEIIDNLAQVSQLVEDAVNNKDATSGRAIAKTALEAHGKVKRATADKELLEREAETAGRKSESLDRLDAKIQELQAQLYKVFKTTEEKKKKEND